MLTSTADLLLPTSTAGSWPRPSWFKSNLHGERFSLAMDDKDYREQYSDAVAAVVSEQERAGLDIVSNGDYHLDNTFAGKSWMAYPLERLAGFSRNQVHPPPPLPDVAPGGLLDEVYAAWRFPAIEGRIDEGTPLDFVEVWRSAQALTDRPVKFGTISGPTALSNAWPADVAIDVDSDDSRQMRWDIATTMNTELRRLAAAGCKVIQLEEPLIHFGTARGASKEHLDFLVDVVNHELEGLDDVEVWIHTCWGNPNMQPATNQATYVDAIDIYLERVNFDVLTLEAKDRGFAEMDLLAPWKGRMEGKKVGVGVVSHRTLKVEEPEEIAADVRALFEFVEPEDLVLTTDCGFGRDGFNRLVAQHKTRSMAAAAKVLRHELAGATA